MFVSLTLGFAVVQLNIGSVSAQGKASELSVATFNIRYDNPQDTLPWVNRHDEVAAAVMFFDVIAFQEALPHQWEDLKSRLPRHDSFGRGRDANGGGEACPIFWNRDRFDLLESQVRWLSLEPELPGSIGWDAELPRVVTIVVLFDRVRNQTVRVLNGHWSHQGELARLGSAALTSGWSGWNDDVTLVCGDFNAEPLSEEISDVLSQGELLDSYETAKYRCRKEFGTYSTFFTEQAAGAPRIDYILYRGDVQADWACADEHIKYGVYISDHYPYHVIFK